MEQLEGEQGGEEAANAEKEVMAVLVVKEETAAAVACFTTMRYCTV